jgi:hypothetical protein
LRSDGAAPSASTHAVGAATATGELQLGAVATITPVAVASFLAPALVRLRLSPADTVALARLIVNENSQPLRAAADGGTEGALTIDSYMIAQVVHDFAAWKRTSHARALHRLSPYVVGGKPAVKRRHAVYRSLPAVGDARPRLWSDELDGPWEAYAQNWVRLREGVAELVANGFPAPCSGRVIAWGGGMDDHIALSRGLVRARCAGEMRNTAWQFPSAYAAAWSRRGVIAAREASGR